MENTGALLFDDKNQKYYFLNLSEIVGPVSTQEVYEKIENGVLSLHDFIYCKDYPDFKRICDEPEFKMLIPSKPEPSDLLAIKNQIQGKKKSTKASDSHHSMYFVFFNKTQYGPFTAKELHHLFEAHKLDTSAYLWQTGWPNWKSVNDVPDFSSVAKSAPAKPSKKKQDKSVIISNRRERRSAPRKPLIARLFVSNDADVVIAVCRDISIGGMQVLTDRMPGEIGSKIKLNVTPAESKNVSGFVAEGEIVRQLEDGRGFSFRFTKLSSDAKKTIESYTKD